MEIFFIKIALMSYGLADIIFIFNTVCTNIPRTWRGRRSARTWKTRISVGWTKYFGLVSWTGWQSNNKTVKHITSPVIDIQAKNPRIYVRDVSLDIILWSDIFLLNDSNEKSVWKLLPFARIFSLTPLSFFLKDLR